MKNKLMTVLVLTGVLGASGYALAYEENRSDESQASVLMEEKTSEAVEAGNKMCPVSGEKISAPGEKGDMGEAVKYEYNGKIYNLCCPMCIKDFKKDPEKYSKIADDEVKNAGEESQK